MGVGVQHRYSAPLTAEADVVTHERRRGELLLVDHDIVA